MEIMVVRRTGVDPRDGNWYNLKKFKETPTVEIREQVDVYWNINKKIFSVKSCSTGKVIMYTDELNLQDAKFVVREAGRQRVLRDKQKNVHAFVRGYIVAHSTWQKKCFKRHTEVRGARYNPYTNDSFVDKETGEALDNASIVKLYTNKAIKGDIKWLK